jgi:biopolymer transport protein ExbB/TolQ
MWIILAIFAASFAVVAIFAFTIASAMEAKRELESWKRKHRRMVEAENAAAWHANRRMMVS